MGPRRLRGRLARDVATSAATAEQSAIAVQVLAPADIQPIARRLISTFHKLEAVGSNVDAFHAVWDELDRDRQAFMDAIHADLNPD